jgi:hypothetical protein
MTRRITDDELARRIVEVLTWRAISAGRIARVLEAKIAWSAPETSVRKRLRALRDEGKVVEVPGPRGSLWRLP